jgi:5'(3')-deoxyribonucleotidase
MQVFIYFTSDDSIQQNVFIDLTMSLPINKNMIGMSRNTVDNDDEWEKFYGNTLLFGDTHEKNFDNREIVIGTKSLNINDFNIVFDH